MTRGKWPRSSVGEGHVDHRQGQQRGKDSYTSRPEYRRMEPCAWTGGDYLSWAAAGFNRSRGALAVKVLQNNIMLEGVPRHLPRPTGPPPPLPPERQPGGNPAISPATSQDTTG